ncbi:MAG: MFS transporter [Vulcanimicrobiota bacterium]
MNNQNNEANNKESIEVKKNNRDRFFRWNFIMGLINGILFQGARAFTSSNIVIPLFLDNFHLSRVFIGLFSSIFGHHGGGIAGGIPQLFVANKLENKPRKKPTLIWAITIRTLCWGSLAFITYFFASRYPQFTVWYLMGILLVFTFMGGVEKVPLMDIWGKAIPGTYRGRFFGHRQFWGSLLAIGTGYLAKVILSSETIQFPNNFALLFLLAFIFMGAGYLALGAVVEPVEEVHKDILPLKDFFRKTLSIVKKDKNYRNYLIVQFLSAFNALALTFYVLYGKDNFNISPTLAGQFIVAQMVGGAVSNLFWAHLADRIRNKKVIIINIFTSILVPLLALLITHENIKLFISAYFLIGFSIAGLRIGLNNFLLDISPSKNRVTYISIAGTLKMPTMFFPLIGGTIAQYSSYKTLFITTIIFLGIGLISSLALKDPNIKEEG